MEAIVNREAFMRALEACKSGLAAREVVEQSCSYVFLSGEVATYNDEASVRGPSGLPKDFNGAVQATQLSEVLRRIDADEVKIASDGDVFAVSTKGTSCEFALESDIRLPLKAVDKPGKFSKLHDDFAEAMNLVRQCAGKDESRPSLTCVHVAKNWLEASDDYQVCRWKMKTGFTQPTLVKRTSVESVAQLGVTEFSEGEGWVHFRNARGFTLSCRRYADEYASETFDPALKAEGQKITLPKQLKEACELANVFSQENIDVNLVRVSLKPGSPGKISVEGVGITGKVKKTLSANWSGDAVAFQIPPTLLIELVGRYNEVQIGHFKNEQGDVLRVLKVDGGSYTYVSMLTPLPEKEK